MFTRDELIIADNIRFLRKKSGLNQDQIAALLQLKGVDMSRGTYAKLETGIRHIYPHELFAIMSILRASVDEVTNGLEF